MGDYFEIIADAEATQDDAARLGASVVSWLTREGIIASEPSDSVLGAESGYPPGPRYTAAVSEPDERLLRLRTNGVVVRTGRSVFSPAEGDVGSVTCPLCGRTVDLSNAATGAITPQWELFRDSFSTWMEGGPGEVRCPRCRQMTRLNDWRWTNEPFVVGFLGFTFWNWPLLTESFIAQMASHLQHQVVVIRGKL